MSVLGGGGEEEEGRGGGLWTQSSVKVIVMWIGGPHGDGVVEVWVVSDREVQSGVKHVGFVRVIVDVGRVLVCPQRLVGGEDRV